MYTCDLCYEDVASPENLNRVWWHKGKNDCTAKLICNDCLDSHDDEAELAEDDPEWTYV